MTTPEKGILSPKNYIESGVNRKFLIPCRRVGLSRTKKPLNDGPPETLEKSNRLNEKEKLHQKLVSNENLVEATSSSLEFPQDKFVAVETNVDNSNSTVELTVKTSDKLRTRRERIKNDPVETTSNLQNNIQTETQDVEAIAIKITKTSSRKSAKDSKNERRSASKKDLNEGRTDDEEFTSINNPRTKRIKTVDKKNYQTFMLSDCEETKSSSENIQCKIVELSQREIETKNKTVQRPVSTDDGDSDDDFFTSSPESYKKQRENLLLLIANAQKEIQQKQETLDKLRQSQIYRKQHDLNELIKSSEKWIEGGRKALEDLLEGMRSRAMDVNMDRLIENLQIPERIVKKFNF